MEKEYQAILTQVAQDKKEMAKKMKALAKKKSKKLDEVIHAQHEAVFAKMDCLKCANCCKTTSPIFRDVDIKRLSKYLKMNESNFIKQFLRIDEDQDYVLQKSPCFFLETDNTCSVYEHRPLACKEYPHTDRKNMYQIMDLTINNLDICPAVGKIMSTILDN